MYTSVWARANQFSASSWKVRRIKFTKVHVMFMSWGRDFYCNTYIFKTRFPLLLLWSISVYASSAASFPSPPPLNYFSLPPSPLPLHTHTSRNQSVRTVLERYRLLVWFKQIYEICSVLTQEISGKHQVHMSHSFRSVCLKDCFIVMNFIFHMCVVFKLTREHL